MDIPPSAAQWGHELKGKIGYSWAKKRVFVIRKLRFFVSHRWKQVLGKCIKSGFKYLKCKYIFIHNPTCRLLFTYEIYILNSCITTSYHFSPQYCYYVVSSFSDYCYVNILLIDSKDNKKLANQRILSRYLTEKCKIWGLGRYFTPSSMGKKCPSSDSKSCSKGRYFWQK